MRNNPLLEEQAAPSHEELEELVLCFCRILRACSVDSESLLGAVRQAIERGSAVPAIRSLPATADQHLACTDVVFYWRHDGRFLGSDGRPLRLPVSGGPRSFEALCMEFATKYEPSSLLEYLRALGTIRVTNSEVDLVADSMLACNSDAGKTVAPRTVVSHLNGFLGSVEFNLLQVGEAKHGRFERAAYASISPELTPVFQRFVETRAQNFVDAVV